MKMFLEIKEIFIFIKRYYIPLDGCKWFLVHKIPYFVPRFGHLLDCILLVTCRQMWLEKKKNLCYNTFSRYVQLCFIVTYHITIIYSARFYKWGLNPKNSNCFCTTSTLRAWTSNKNSKELIKYSTHNT